MRSPLAVAAAFAISTALLVLPTSSAAETAPAPMPTLRAPVAFSPDGNGVADTARLRFTLPRADRVSLQIRDNRGARLRVVRLGRLAAGSHTWRWDGRDQRGRMLPDGLYYLRLRPSAPDPRQVTRQVRIDTAFQGTLSAPQRYGVPAGRAPVQVFPRTGVVRDGIDLDVRGDDFWGDLEALSPISRVRLVVEDSDGRVVLRRTKARVATSWRVRWTARRGGAPLPPGDYTATLRGVDSWGNAGRSKPLALRVSGKRLVWQEETRVLPAVDHRIHSCTFSEANGCGDFPPYGTVLPSTRYPGGLTFQSATPPTPTPGSDPGRARARQDYYLPVPATAGVRGVDSARLSFVGTPTETGEGDLGHLALWAAGASYVSSASGATTPWMSELSLGQGDLATGLLPRFDPGVVWSFETRGTDSFDVATFTVDLRYLVPE